MWFYFEDIEETPTGNPKLIRFLEDTRDFLGRLIQHGKAFVPELVESIRRAWNTGLQRFNDIITRALLLTQTQLESHGLTGEELRLKPNLVSHYFGELISGGGKGILRKLFDVIDTLLDSILQALGVPGAVKEIKDSIRSALAA